MKPSILRRLQFRALAFLLLAAFAAAARADAVFDWIEAMPAVLKDTKFRSRTATLAELAMFDALNAIERRYRPFGPPLAADADTSREAALASAARTVLASAPGADAARITSLYNNALAKVPEGAPKAKGIALGQKAALAVLALRADDDLSPLNAAPRELAPGVVELSTDPAKPTDVAWARLRPMGVRSIEAFDPGPPPVATSAAALRDIAEVKALGGADSATRTADQTAVALFWNSANDADFIELFKGLAEARKLDPLDSVRMLALSDLADFNAGIAITLFKDRYRYWRPVHAIKGRFADASVRDAAWQPLIVQRGVQAEYPSGAGVSAGVAEVVLARFAPAGAAMTMRNSATGQVRSWKSAQALGEEQALSRVWGGIHYRSTVEASRVLGRRIAEEVLATQLQPR